MTAHAASAVHDPGDCHGYPWRPACGCGWLGPVRYVTRDAALTISIDHAKEANR